jgi:histidinol-phosphate aminotransferase
MNNAMQRDTNPANQDPQTVQPHPTPPVSKITPRQAVAAIRPYQPPLEGRRDFIRLDFNENTTGFPWAYSEDTPGELLTAYPEYDRFLEAIAQAWNVPTDRLLLTNASDEALFVIAFTFIEPGQDTAITAAPTFALIPHYLKLVQSKLIEVPITDDLEYDTPAIEAQLRQGVKLAMFASPDNPVGCLLPLDKVRDWCARFPETLFVMDEAYAEFSGVSALPLVDEFANLLVTRTFSKAWGLAGLRLGAIIGRPELIDYLKRVRSPYSVNAYALHMAIRMLPRYDEIKAEAQVVMQRKARIVETVRNRGYRVVAGHANFFMMAVGFEAKAFCEFFRERGILLRDRSSMHKLEGMVRISTGSEAEMQQFLDVLDAWRQSRALIFDMDGTLVDTSASFDATVAAMVEKYSGQPLQNGELKALRGEGGFNDDWDATVELLRRRGVQKTYDEISIEATALYLSLAPQTETWLVPPETLGELKRRHRLAVATGRFRSEYDPIWKDRFNPLFEQVVCQDDCPAAQKKPQPDLLLAALQKMGATGGVYVGNSVDDMQAAKAAGLRRIAVTTTHDAELLRAAGAEVIIDSLEKLGDFV